jgi:prepilin-type N-terminal cleavage/methylation domain-containing protein
MSSPRRRVGRAAAGFTLLEVMLAMVCLAMVAAVCYGAFHLGIRALERGEVAVVTAQRLRAASDVLIRQIKSAGYCLRTEDDEFLPYFRGNETSMSFVTAAGLEGGGGLKKVDIWVEPGEPNRLMMAESAFFSPDSLGGGVERVASTPPRAVVLLEGFTDLHFGYYLYEGDPEEDAKAVPMKSWDAVNGDEEQGLVPFAVRILVEGLPGMGGDPWGHEIPIMMASYSSEFGDGPCDTFFYPDRFTGEGVGTGTGTGGDGSSTSNSDDPDDGDDAGENYDDVGDE